MTELLDSDWKWDFVLNLSESDFPIKSVDKLTDFLSANTNKNFVKSHGREVQRFIQKQGLDKTFVECDTHMWRVGDRTLPDGIQIDGGSDWVCLSRKFVEYVTSEMHDELIEGLMKIFQLTLLPAESFFHTAIRNSLFCDTYVDNNLHITNWKRKLGCKCQYRHICDWCGCSPNVFKPDDWLRLQATDQKQLFFGRKFEPVVNQLVILQLEEWLFGPYNHGYVNLNSYWQNIYHFLDKSPSPNEDLLTVTESLIRINSKSNSIQQFYEPLKVLEVHDYFEMDVYKGFLIKHEARINSNLTVELETLCRPNNQHAQVSKTNKIAKKIMQLDVSGDFDQKELISRNFPRIIGQNSEPILIVKLSGTSHVENTTVTLSVMWIDPNDEVIEVGELVIEDVTITSINFSKSNIKNPTSGTWTVKIMQKKTLVGMTKFLITPSSIMNSNSNNVKTKDLNSSQNQLDKLISNFYVIKDTCISYNQKNIRDIIGSYLGNLGGTNDIYNSNNIIKFNECKKSLWSSYAPDPKSELITDLINFDGSSS
jgi:protein xylosyltransferase